MLGRIDPPGAGGTGLERMSTSGGGGTGLDRIAGAEGTRLDSLPSDRCGEGAGLDRVRGKGSGLDREGVAGEVAGAELERCGPALGKWAGGTGLWRTGITLGGGAGGIGLRACRGADDDELETV